jgi:hypothetical protein
VRVLDQDVLGGAVDAQAVGVLAGLDGDAVVAVLDVDLVDMDVFGGVDVDAVGAGDVVVGDDAQVVDLDVLAVEDEEAPDGLVVQVEAGDGDVS